MAGIQEINLSYNVDLIIDKQQLTFLNNNFKISININKTQIQLKEEAY